MKRVHATPAVWLLVLILVLGLAACEKSLAPESGANGSDAAVATEGGVLADLNMIVTQTALAREQTAPKTTPGAPVVGGPTAAPGGDQVTLPMVVGGDGTPAAPDAALPTDAVVPVEPEPVVAEPIEEPLPTMIVVPTATPGLPNKYKIQKDEYIYCLARRFDLDPVALMNANGLGPSSLLNTGQALKLPDDAPKFPGDRQLLEHPTVVTVAAGDTIYTLACAFGDVDPMAIAYANGLTAPYKLSAGQRLHIP